MSPMFLIVASSTGKLSSPSGGVEVYGAVRTSTTTTIRHYFLSEVRDERGRSTSTIEYASATDVACPTTGTGSGPPYIRRIVSGDYALVAVLSYRAFAFWLPTIPGALAYLALRRTVSRWRQERVPGARAVA